MNPEVPVTTATNMGTRIQLGIKETSQVGGHIAGLMISANPIQKKITLGLNVDGEWLPEKDLAVWE